MTQEVDPMFYYEVPEDERLEEDGGPLSDATQGGTDEELLSEVYSNPGEVVEIGGDE